MVDDTVRNFCNVVLDLRHKHIPRCDLEQVAFCLRDTVIPQLEELDVVKAENLRLRADLAASALPKKAAK